MKHLQKTLLVVAAVASAIPSLEKAVAASQGGIGATSTATVEVTLTVPPLFRISGLGGLSLGSYTPNSGDMSANDDICVWTNMANGDYAVTIIDNSAMTPDQFAVENSEHTEQVPMEVLWNGHTGTIGSSAAAYGVSMPATGANTQASDCSIGGPSANLQVIFRESDLLSAVAGSYSSELYVVIGPSS